MKTKPVFVGDQNPYGGDPSFALYPMPEGCAGERLCYDILGMYKRDYLEVFDRTNLVEGPWHPKKAADKAQRMWGGDWECEPGSKDVRRLVLLGSRVCKAFGVVFAPFTHIKDRVLILPHPSGLCRLWNDDTAITQAREAMVSFYPEVAGMLGRFDK